MVGGWETENFAFDVIHGVFVIYRSPIVVCAMNGLEQMTSHLQELRGHPDAHNPKAL